MVTAVFRPEAELTLLQDQIFDRKRLNSRFRTLKSYYFELTCMSQKAIVYVDCAN